MPTLPTAIPHSHLYKRNCKGDFLIPYKTWFEWYLNHGKFHNTEKSGSRKYPPTRMITHKEKHPHCIKVSLVMCITRCHKNPVNLSKYNLTQFNAVSLLQLDTV